MIKINPSIIDNNIEKIKCVYQRPCHKPNKKEKLISLVEMVAREMSALLEVKDKTDSEKIVELFLLEYFTDTSGNISDALILKYLLNNRITQYIQGFWECVCKVWIPKLQNDSTLTLPPKLQDLDITKPNSKDTISNIAQCLSKWNGIREQSIDENDKKKRYKQVTKVIKKRTLPFFVEIAERDIATFPPKNTAISDKERLGKVKFRYHTDLYKEDERTASDTSNDNTENAHNKSKPKSTMEILQDIFDYGLLKGNLRHELLSAMYVPVCPYCNRQYITVYKDNKERGTKTTADLDHFYIKSKYPYLALSVYNFVPSCQVCNSRTKLDTDFHGTPHLYPYEQASNSEMTFSVNDLRMLMAMDKTGTEWRDQVKTVREHNVSYVSRPSSLIKINGASEAASNSIRTFCLNEVYQVHADYVYELIWKKQAYNDAKIDQFFNEFRSLFTSKEEFKALLYGQYLNDEDVHKRPLAKLTLDILNS